MLSYRKTFQGAWEIVALVYYAGQTFYHHEQYFYYTKREATQRFRQSVKHKGYKLIRGY
jgi:hypothetical protein